ncbi:GRAM domain-containing protein [Reichenbachiella ulvae]|uniref:GRAM domain-containing protein n=1 Tax=Reichenbachiella ulvae TaxID=2980104 RepID=A0ABT3CP26_9BACT|nr:GRAM domain-containing protein [Reichenbachiella ulvae]MCV9385465.1 GRAM domain-containing protein [Reichenbachiella ulvae]
MKVSFKQKLLFSLISGLSFAILNSLMYYVFLDKGFIWEIFMMNWILFGFLFGFGFLFFMQRMTTRLMNNIQIQLADDEIVRHEGGANLMKGIEAVGGKLVLTDQRLIFKSHQKNVQSGETQLPLTEIQEVIPRKTAKLFQNGMRVLNQAGEAFDFVVYEREVWLEKVKTASFE